MRGGANKGHGGKGTTRRPPYKGFDRVLPHTVGGCQYSDIIQNIYPRRGRPIQTMNRAKYGAAGALAVWCTVVGYFMLLNRTLDLEVYFVLALIGLLVVAVLIDTPFAQPKYMRRMKYIIAAGVAAFGYIVVMKIMEIVAK